MKQFLNILRFEFFGYLKNKIFTGVTLALVLVIALVLTYPRFSGIFKGSGSEDTAEKEKIMLVDNVSADKDVTLTIFKTAMTDYDIALADKSVDELKQLVDSGEYQSAIVITSPTTYSYIVKNVGMYDAGQTIIDEVMLNKYRIDAMANMGVQPERASEMLATNITSELIQTGKDQRANFFYTYVLIFGLYMAILLYGQFVATSVATEKSSRAMELLITSANPVNLMFGKVIGAGLAGLLQICALLGSSFVFFNINKSFWDGNMVVNSIFNMPVSILLYTVLFFTLGYFIYSFLYGAVGSLASKVEDINTSSMPITTLFIAAFMVVMFSMGSGNVDSPLMVVASYVPFTSPMAMFTRIAMGDVASYEIIISVVILVISTAIIGYISAKIYKVGVLLYGKTPKLSNILKSMRNK